MRRLAILVLIVVALALPTTEAFSTDGTALWNQYAGSYNFNTTYQSSSPYATFEQNYNGGDFAADFSGILNAISQALGTETPGFSGDDVMSASLHDWPDP